MAAIIFKPELPVKPFYINVAAIKEREVVFELDCLPLSYANKAFYVGIWEIVCRYPLKIFKIQ